MLEFPKFLVGSLQGGGVFLRRSEVFHPLPVLLVLLHFPHDPVEKQSHKDEKGGEEDGIQADDEIGIADLFPIGKVGDKDDTARQQPQKAEDERELGEGQGGKAEFSLQETSHGAEDGVDQDDVDGGKKQRVLQADILQGKGKDKLGSKQAEIIDDYAAEIAP